VPDPIVEQHGGGQIPQPYLARRILLVVLCSYVFVGIINVRLDNPPLDSRFWWICGCMAAVFALQLTHITSSAPQWPLWRKALSLGAQAVATYMPFVLFHAVWGGMAGFLAGSFLLLVPRPAAWAYFSAVVASIYFFAQHYYHEVNWIAYYLVATMLLGLIVFGMTRLSQLVTELYELRGELARMAVTRERLRIARDLHDLLGYSISSITLKSELTFRLVARHPERAQQELSEILEISRQALADVRTVARAYRDMSLTAEAATAKDMLEAAEIEVEMRLECGPLSAAVDTALATALREGVTNMLRHSKAQHCAIHVSVHGERVRLTLVNDGLSEQLTEVPTDAGSGLSNIRTRLAALGGTLTVAITEDRRFSLVAEAPAQAEARAEPAPEAAELEAVA
jgi:two-component system, NarL family, sensor histidine kinase DesK